MSCVNHKSFTVGTCFDNIIVKALDSSKQLEWRLINKFDQVYSGVSTTDLNGALIIPVVTQDFFQPFSGSWKLECYDNGDRVLFCGMYDFIEISFQRVTPANSNAVIDLKCG